MRIGIGYSQFQLNNEENSVTPLLELLSTEWSSRPEVTEKVSQNQMLYQYRYSRLVGGGGAERQRRMELVVETKRDPDGTRNELEIAHCVELNMEQS